jgi:hypothetical protein
MTPTIIVQLVQMVIAFLLQLFGRQPAAVADYIAGNDCSPLFRPFVMAMRRQRLKTFIGFYSITHGLDPAKTYEIVLGELQGMSAGQIASVAAQLPAA